MSDAKVNWGLVPTKRNYHMLVELLELAHDELSAEDYEWLTDEWKRPDVPEEKLNEEPAVYGVSWRDIEILTGAIEGLGVSRAVLGEVFGVDPSEEPWLFD